MSKEFSKITAPSRHIQDSHDDDHLSHVQKVDPYRFSDPSTNKGMRFVQQIRRFDLTDILLILGVFIVGFMFALILANYYKVKKEKIDEISKKFKGLKGEYEQVQVRLENYTKWKYRVKCVEKIYYVLLLSLGFLCYKSPSLLTYFFIDMPHFTIPFLSFAIIAFSLTGFWFEQKTKDQEKRTKKLKEKLKDTKRLLIS
jgi:hypothetical protein